jgi:glutamine cyclotransferase
LTWQTETGFIYDATDFRLRKRFSYKGEGWGLATDGHELFMSDGTEDIHVLDPVTFTERRRFGIHNGTTSVAELNELEFVDGQILRTYGTAIGSRGFRRKMAPLWDGLMFTGCWVRRIDAIRKPS